MKKYLYLLLFFSSFVNAQLTISQPTELYSCMDFNYGVFDLTSKNSEILGDLDPALFSVSYYEIGNDCINAFNSIQNTMSYVKSSSGYVQVRVFENQNTQNVGYTSLFLQPILTNYLSIKDLTVFETPNDNSAVFNLTNATELNAQSGLAFSYFLNESDANSNVNSISNPTTYVNTTNPQIIYARFQVTSYDCFVVKKFKLYVESDGIINFTDQNLKNKLLSATTSNSIASNVNPNNTATWNIHSKIDTNLDGEIQISEANEIIYLNISGNSSSSNSGIQNLQGLEHFKNLFHLNCKYGQLNAIDVSVFERLKYLYCSYNNMTYLNLTNAKNLESIDCGYNLLTSLNTNDCESLNYLQARNNQISSINLNNNNNLEWIYLWNNNLTNFEINNKNYLRTLEIGYNQLTNIQLTNLPLLYRVKAQGNNLINVDLSSIAFQTEPNNVPSANQLDISLNNNVNLKVVNLKNGFYNSNISFFSGNLNDSQQFICVEDNDVFTFFGSTPNPVLNSYCSFNPGGNYNTINGSMIFDTNNNGCDANDIPQPNIKININNGINGGSTFTNNSGNFKFYTDAGSFALTPNVENPTWFTFSPTTATIPFANNNNNTTTQNFCISANGVHPDLEIAIAPIVPARPGFNAVYQIVYKNIGNQTMTQQYGVNFFYDQNVMSFVSSNVATSSTGSGSVSWDYATLKPFESRTINVTLHVNAPTDANPVNIGNILILTANVLATGDQNNANNLFQFNQTVVGSYDPNDITCMEGNSVSPTQIGNYLHYNINFENTGTSQAENIVVKVDVDPNDFDVNSLQMLASSNDAYVRIEGNKVEFIFHNIMLDSGGHGNVLLKIRSKNTLVSGDMVGKRADIFFDYNFPIDTGFANTTFGALNNSEFHDATISVYPNPTSGIVTIEGKSNLKSIQLFDVQGRLLQTKLQNDVSASIDISDKLNGIYFLKITSETGIKVEKIIKK